jgi:hypothetical protein
MRGRVGGHVVLAALAPAIVAAGCRCGGSEPGKVGKAATIFDAIPGDVQAVLVVNAEGLRQGSLGRYVYGPFVVTQFREWGETCAALPARSARSAALGFRLSGGKRVFAAADGIGVGEVRACVDEYARKQGLSASLEAIAGIRAVTDSRGIHVLVAGPEVVALSFPFCKVKVLEQVSKVVDGRAPSLAGNAAFRDLLVRLGGDVTIALWETHDLFQSFGRDLEETVAAMVPADLCATPGDIATVLSTASLVGFGELAGVRRVMDAKFAGLEKVCVADLVRETFRTAALVRAAGVTLTGRADAEFAVLLVFNDAAPAEELRGLLADLLHVVAVLPERLDTLESVWPKALDWISSRVDLLTLRTTLRHPAFEHVTVGGEGATFELRVRIDEADVPMVVNDIQQALSKVISRD